MDQCIPGGYLSFDTPYCFSAERIFSPYTATLRSPNPGTCRSSLNVRGRRRHSSSSDVSCITTKAGTDCSFDAPRRHSRRYSRKPGSTSPSEAFGVRADLGALVLHVTGLDTWAGCESHSVPQPHISHASQESHLGISPKCTQIWRWRHDFESTKRRIE